MKKIFAIALLALVALQMQAQRRSAAERMAIAQDVLEAQTGQTAAGNRRAQVVSRQTDGMDASGMRLVATSQQVLGDEADAFSVYGYNDGRPGFVIVSADEASHAVLAYSTTDDFDLQALPEEATRLLRMYARRAQASDLTTAMLRQSQRAAGGRLLAPAKEVAPLLGDINFNQRSPFNDLCPLYQGQRCLTGCTATAMSQLMAYYQHPKRMNTALGSTISYTTRKNKIDATWNVSTTQFDWQNILHRYTALIETMRDVQFNSSHAMTLTGFVYDEEWSNYIALTKFSNKSGSTFGGVVRLFVENESGKLLGYASGASTIESLGANYYYNNYHIRPALSADLADGTYRIFAATLANGNYFWQRASNPSGQDYITVQKHGNTFTVLGHDFTCGYTEQQGKAVATLSGACAYSLEADFGTGSTSGSIVNMANSFIDYMDYSDHLQYVEPEYFSKDGWHQYLQAELNNKRPIFVSGFTADQKSGHAFIIDGLQNRNGVPYYHVNWGWGGSSDGYFLIDYLKPSEAGDGGYEVNYGEDVTIIANIKPNDNDQSLNLFGVTNIAVNSKNLRELEYLTVTVNKLTNCSFFTAKNVSVRAVLTNPWGKEYDLGQVINVDELKPRYYWNELSPSFRIPKTVPTGDYTLELRLYNSTLSRYTVVTAPQTITLHLTTSTDASVGVEGIKAAQSAGKARFDLNGRPVTSSTRGVIVSGGRKVIKN